MIWIYNTAIALYSLGIKTASLFSHKAKLLYQGRQDVWTKIKEMHLNEPVIWIHAASLGEFEQGRPLIEAIKKQYPDKKIVLTFFSPSGYEIRKDYTLADAVYYLPSDTKQHAVRFIEAIHPSLVFFIKYEFWFHYLTQLKKRDIPVYGVSVIFRKDQLFFKWFGSWTRKMLKAFQFFYVQDEASGNLLKSIGFLNYGVTGDTRFDRVKEIADASSDIPVAKAFSDNAITLVAGSSWPADEKILSKYINSAPENFKLIIAPHEIDDDHVQQIEDLLAVKSFRITAPPPNPGDYKVMIVNTMGMLSSIYKYGQLAYIGGGFGSGIHNTLEAATYRIPVIFGPNYKKYKEACDLIQLGGGFEIGTFKDFESLLNRFLAEDVYLKSCGEQAGGYVLKMCGATEAIMNDVFPANDKQDPKNIRHGQK